MQLLNSFHKFKKLIQSSYDIWNDYTSQDPGARHATLGYSMRIPGICSKEKYSIMEFNGFNEIQNAAHELGHILGAVHDGGVSKQGIDATSCPASKNNIMTPNAAAFSDANAMYYFSDCSIESFKNTLLTSDKLYIIVPIYKYIHY